MQSAPVLRALRCAVCGALSVLVIVGATYLRHVNHTTVALVLVLLILGFAIRWGWLEALVTSLAGGLGFDYFFLPPRSFGLEEPEHWLTLGAFLVTAITTGQLAARAARNRDEADRRRREMERLYLLGNSLLDAGSMEGALDRLPRQIVEVFQAQSAAFFDQQGNRIFRWGAEDDCISEDKLRSVAAAGNSLITAAPACCLVPIHRGGNLVGSLGVAGALLSRSLAEAIAERIGVALAQAYTAQETVAAELSRRSEDLKSAVLDALAHEIKGPLATVKVAVSTLRSQHPGSLVQQKELLAIIDEESDRIERWIDNATQISRRDAGLLHPEKKPHSLKQVAECALEGLGPAAGGRTIEVRIPDSLPVTEFDAEMIAKVIRLVLDNALRYSPAGSPIVLSAEFTGAEIVLSVRDHGPGVPESERERIFDSHYRGSTATKGTPGTGLGLASAKCIMQAHGGEIWVTSADGNGSLFHLSLPVNMELSDERVESPERG